MPAVTARPPRTWLYGSLAAAAVFHAVFVARTGVRFDGSRHFTLFDDAMISMRYARNLAHGHGLVWNAGEPPVEGITNPLWTVWMAVVHLVPFPEAQRALLVSASSSALLLANVVVVWFIARRLAPASRLAPPVAAVMTALSYALAFWSLRGMEVALLAFCIDVALLAVLRRRTTLLAVALAAAVLTRQDALLPAAIVGAYAVLDAPAGDKRRVAVAVIAATVGTTVALTLFRLAYYGDALPNTYYLKTTGVALSTRLHRGWVALRQIAVHQLAPVVALAVLAFTTKPRQLARYTLAAIFAAQCAYSVFVGGDAWENEPFANRYLAVALPSLILLAALGADAIAAMARRAAIALAFMAAALLWFAWLRSHDEVLFTGSGDGKPAFAVAIALIVIATLVVGIRLPGPATAIGTLVVALVLSGYIPLHQWWRHGASLARADAMVAAQGDVERRTTDTDARIAVWWAGNGPYFSHRSSIDLLGKSDRHVARTEPTLPFRPGHNKIDLDYSVRRLRPDVIDAGVFVAQAPGEAEAFTRWGYEQIVDGVFVRRDSRRVDRMALARGVRAVRREVGP